MSKIPRCLELAIALVALLSAEVAVGQSFQGTFDKHQLVGPSLSQASTATAMFPFSDSSLSHGDFVGSIQMTASPETLSGELDVSQQKMAAPIHIGMTIKFTSTLPQRARDQNTFQKFRTTLSVQIDDAITNCTAAPQVQSGLEFGPHSYSASFACDFPTPSFSVSLSQNGAPLTGYSLFRTLVQFLIEPDSGGFSNYSAEVYTFFQWDSSDVQDIQPSVISNDPARSSEKVAVKITGRSFEPNSTLSFGEGITVTSTRVNSATEIEAEISAAGGTPEGPRDVTVTKPSGAKQVRRGAFYVSSLGPAIEVNQGVPIECKDDHPCVADHNTWVRVRLPCYGAGCALGKSAATGRLHVKRDGQAIAGSPFRSDPMTMAVKEAGTAFDLPAQKAGADALNFRFMDEATLGEGGYDFSFEIDPRSPSAIPGGAAPDARRNLIRELKSQRFVLSRFDRAIHVSAIVDQAPAARRLNPIDPLALTDFTQAVFPISKDRVTIGPSLYEDQYGPDLIPTLRRLQSLAVLEAVHNQPAQTYVVMFTTNSLLAPSVGASSCSEGSCWGNSAVILWEGENSRASLAHELGHHQRLGDTYTNDPPGGEDRVRRNPPCAHVSGCPVESGYLDTIRGELSVALPASDPNFLSYTKRDVMGNAPRPQRWIDKNTWDYLYPTFMSTGSGAQRAVAQERWLIVRGTVSEADVVSFDPFVSYAGEEIGPRTDEGNYRVELLDGTGSTLGLRTFAAAFKVPHQARTVSSSPFQATLPFPTAAVRVVVKKDGREIASKAISANAPTVTVTAPNGGETIGVSTTISWTASDADGDALTFSVLYSPDGTRWSALATDLTATSYAWTTTKAPGSHNARIMVVASDGVNSGTDTSDGPFTLATKAPLLKFTAPADGAAFPAGQPVTISGFAYDLEDGQLPGSALTYSSDRNGPLGTGSAVTVANLAAGAHAMTLRATDHDGTVSTAQIHVTVFTPGADLSIVPVAGSTPGSGGSFFKTAVQIHNPTSATIAGNFVYHPQGQGGSSSDPRGGYMLLPGQTISYADLLPELGQSGLGTVDLIATFGPAPTSVIRIFNDAGAAGTTGMTEEPMTGAEALKQGETGILIAPPEPSRARFNIGVRSLANGATIRFTVRDAAGAVRTTGSKFLPPVYFAQQAAEAFLGIALLANDTIAFEVDAGSVIVYGATTDNTTQDPSLQFARPLRSGSDPRRTIAAVAAAPGVLDSLFKTTLQLHNPTATAIAGRLVFHPGGFSGSDSDPTITYSLAPGATTSYADVLSAFGRTGLGSLDIVATAGLAPLAVARVFNDGGVRGTTGFSVDAARPEDALQAGETGVLIAPADPAAARFNVGLRTFDAGATLSVTIRNRDGETIRTFTRVYAPSYFEQQGGSVFLGAAPGPSESVAITVTAGSAIVYGASTDNKTQDPAIQVARAVRP